MLESIDEGYVSGIDIEKISKEQAGYNSISIAEDLPISLDVVKEYCRVDDPAEDHTVDLLLRAAIEQVEKFTNMVIDENIYAISFDTFAKKTILPIAPVQKLLEVVTIQEGKFDSIFKSTTGLTGDVTDYSSDLYQLQENNQFYITGTFRKTLNFVTPTQGSLRVIVKAGYNKDTYKAIPSEIQNAILKICKTNFEHREDIITGSIQAKLDNSSKKMLAKYRLF